jgi:DNA-binding MarR family transcriptional regulator
VGEAAAELHLAANTVSTLVTSLVTTGWIRRETDPQDARSAQLFLTGEADRRIEERRDRWLAALIEAMASLAPEEQERIAAAIPALDRLVTRLTDGE